MDSLTADDFIAWVNEQIERQEAEEDAIRACMTEHPL